MPADAATLRGLLSKSVDLLVDACKTLSIKNEDLMGRLTALGKLIGSPWSQDEKFAALAAWLALFAQG